MHAGYALFEILYWQNSSPVAAPWQEMLLLHDAITILTSFAYLVRALFYAFLRPGDAEGALCCAAHW